MPDHILRDRLIALVDPFLRGLRDRLPTVDVQAASIVNALLVSEEWQAREAVIRAAKREHEGCDGVGIDLEEEASAPCAMCHYLARLAAVRGTT